MGRFVLVVVASVGVAAGSVAHGQPPEKASKELEPLRMMAGTWDVTASTVGVKSKGSAVIKLGLEGRCVTSESKGELLGQKYESRGLAVYDAAKKKYVFVWADSLSTTLTTFEGTYDEKAKKLTAVGEVPGQDDKPVKLKMVIETKSADEFVQTLLVVSDGKDQELLAFTFTRKK